MFDDAQTCSENRSSVEDAGDKAKKKSVCRLNCYSEEVGTNSEKHASCADVLFCINLQSDPYGGLKLPNHAATINMQLQQQQFSAQQEHFCNNKTLSATTKESATRKICLQLHNASFTLFAAAIYVQQCLTSPVSN